MKSPINLFWNTLKKTTITILLIYFTSYASQIPIEFKVADIEPIIKPFKATVIAKVLYIREKPSDRSPIIGSLKWGEIVYLETPSGFRTKPDGEERFHQWFKISERYGSGWVWGGYLKVNIKSVEDSTFGNVILKYIPDARFQIARDLSFITSKGIGFTGPLFLIDLNNDSKKELVIPIYDGSKKYILILKYPSLEPEKSFTSIGIYYKIVELLCNFCF
ncbi:MAG: SH3 domain-containing protein [bacterium]